MKNLYLSIKALEEYFPEEPYYINMFPHCPLVWAPCTGFPRDHLARLSEEHSWDIMRYADGRLFRGRTVEGPDEDSYLPYPAPLSGIR